MYRYHAPHPDDVLVRIIIFEASERICVYILLLFGIVIITNALVTGLCPMADAIAPDAAEEKRLVTVSRSAVAGKYVTANLLF